MFLIILQNLFLASTFTLGKAAMEYAQPVFFVGMRMLLGGLLLLGYQYFFNYSKWRLDKKDIGDFVQMVFFHIAISFGCEFWALQYASASKVAFLWNLAPFVTALIAYFYCSEKITFKQWIGLSIGFLGMLPVLLTSDSTELASGSFSFLSMAEIVLFVGIISGSYAWFIMKRLVTDKGYSTIMVNGVAMFFGGMVDMLASLIIEPTPYITLVPRFGQHCDTTIANMFCQVLPQDYLGVGLLAIYTILLVLVANVFYFNLYGYLLNYYSNTFISFCGFTIPLFAVLLDWLFVGEVVSRWFFLAVFIVSIGLYIFYQDELTAKPKKS